MAAKNSVRWRGAQREAPTAIAVTAVAGLHEDPCSRSQTMMDLFHTCVYKPQKRCRAGKREPTGSDRYW
jgi:hypothetical protein